MKRTLVLMLALFIPPAAQAQSVITGVVRDLQNKPISDVEMSVVSPEQKVRSDSAGKFRLVGLDSGTYSLRARRLGYLPVGMTLTLAKNDTVGIVVDLQKRPIMLDTVQVTASCPRFEFKGFVCRRRALAASGTGFFFDVDAIDSLRPRFPIDMLRDIPGIRVIAPRVGRGGLVVESTHDFKCAIVTIANGKKPSLQNPLPVWPADMIAVEVYPTAKDIPPEYGQFLGLGGIASPCGLVNYWTVPRPRKKK